MIRLGRRFALKSLIIVISLILRSVLAEWKPSKGTFIHIFARFLLALGKLAMPTVLYAEVLSKESECKIVCVIYIIISY